MIDGCMRHNVWTDCDYSGCYPTCLSLVPLIDVNGEVRECRATYLIDDDIEGQLRHEGLSVDLIHHLKSYLSRSETSFLKELSGLKNRRLAKQVRQLCERYDNSLLEDVVSRSREFKPGEGVIPAFFKVWFSFPRTTLFPCLPVPDERYGLVYPFEGETCVPASEVLLALDAGAEIRCLWSVELPIARDDQGKPILFLQRHLRALTQERDRYKKEKKLPNAAVLEKLLKEFSNSFYGKFAQGINAKNASDEHGRSRRMPPSSITEPCVAALVTSLARAALSAALIAIERFNRGRDPLNQINVASCTTDGFLIGLPATEGFSVLGDYYRYVESIDGSTEQQKKGLIFENPPSFADLLDRFGCGELLDYFAELLPLRQMRQARIDLVGKDDYIEIKHMADYLVSVKTRGQLGFLNSGECTILARFGIKVPLSDLYENREEYKEIMTVGGYVRNTADAQWIMKKIKEAEEGGEIDTYNHITLETFTRIIESEGTKDLTTRNARPRRINTGFDYKRRLVWKDKDLGLVSPFSVPHGNIGEMRRMRAASERIRRQGKNATPVKVLNQFTVREQTVRYRNGVEATLVREFLRVVLSGGTEASLPETDQGVADVINVVWAECGYDLGERKIWTRSDVTYAKRPRSTEPGVFDKEPGLVELANRLADALGLDRAFVGERLFSKDLFLYYLAPVARDVVTALLNGAPLGRAPFMELAAAGLLPTRSRLKELFGHLVSDIDRIPYQNYPALRDTADRQMIHGLFKRAGLSSKAASEATAAIVATKVAEVKKCERNTVEKACLESFVKALHQPDMTKTLLKSSQVIRALEPFGLTRSIYYRLRDEKFVCNSLRRTDKRRHQIDRMARSLSLPAEPFYDALME